MKKLYLFVVIAMFGNIVLAQDIDDVKKYALLAQSNFEQAVKAREVVDKYLAVEKNAQKPDGWFYKGYIYNLLSKDTTKSLDKCANLKGLAFEALKKYRELDSKAELLSDMNNGVIIDIYYNFLDLGINLFQKNNLDAAFENFKKALEVHDYFVSNNLIGANGYKFSSLDTILTLYTGITAEELAKQYHKQLDTIKDTIIINKLFFQESQKKKEAIGYYKKLVDANVTDEKFFDAYRVLAEYYEAQKDKVAFLDILNKGKKYFPKNDEYWIALEIENATVGVGKPAVFSNYDTLMIKYPNVYELPYNYSIELYHYIYSDEMKNANPSVYKTKLIETIKKAIDIKSTIEANFLLANFLYSNSIDISEEARKLKGPKPDDLKRKKELEAKTIATMSESIPYAEAVETLFAKQTKPKNSEKNSYKQALVILKSIYEVKKDAAKMAAYDKKIKEAE